MSIFISGRPLPSIAQLGRHSQHVLGFIDGGRAWLQWAIESRQNRYSFEDETSLLDAVQRGLHGCGMTWLPNVGLQVSPIKLLSLGFDDREVLRRQEQDEAHPAMAQQVQQVLARHRLLTATALASYRPFLAAIGVASAPLLQQLDFRDALRLHQLAAEQQGAGDAGESLAEAARFALQHACNPAEFVDYFRFYQHLHPTASSSERRLAYAGNALTAVLPVLFGCLEGIQLSRLPGPAEVSTAIETTLLAGRTMGYPRLSLAAQQMAALLGKDPDQAPDRERVGALALQHFRAAQAFVADHPVGHGQLGQDGASILFVVEASREQALVQVEDNVVNLLDYRRMLRFADSETVADARPALTASDDLNTAATSTPSGAPTMTFPIPPDDRTAVARAAGKSPMQIAQELADAAIAASEEGVRSAMEVLQRAVEEANEAVRRAEEQAEQAVKRANEASGP